MTHFTNIKEDNNNLYIDINNNDKIKLSLTNALRRIIISQIPLFAIDEKSIIFDKNTSMLHNSFLAKRLTLLPINYENLKNYDVQKINISLNVENNEDHILSIYTKDFNIEYDNNNIENIFTHNNILFAKLKPEQYIKLNCKVKKSNAELDGSPFTSVCKSIITYKRDEKIIESVTKDLNSETKEKFLNTIGETYYLKNKNNEPAVYQVSIESVGMIKPTDIISVAINILNEKLKNIQKALNENIESKIKIDITNKLFKSYDFTIFDENHTLGNIISSYLLDNTKINYAAYIIPHPNDNKLVITTDLKNNNTLEENKKVFLETLQNLINLVDKLYKEWETVKSVKKTVKKIIIKKI